MEGNPGTQKADSQIEICPTTIITILLLYTLPQSKPYGNGHKVDTW